MPQMLLVNPRARRKSAKSPRRAPRRRASPRRGRARRRRSNPIANLGMFSGRRSSMRISRRRRRNPIPSFGRRRRRNPINLGGLSSNKVMSMFKDAAIGGAGAIVMDVVMGQVNGFLPATFQTSKTQIGVGDAVKAGITAILGTMASRATKGLSMRMAQGALAVQAYELLSSLVPSSLTLGYGSPARLVNASARVGPTRGGMLQAYQRPGARSPLLSGMNQYVQPGRTPLLNGRMSSAQEREGTSPYR